MSNTVTYGIGSRFVSREGYKYEIIDYFMNGNLKVTEQRGRRKPVRISVPKWAIENNLRGGYWTMVS